MARRNLTAKQRLFAQYYVQTLNGTKAARLAGYSPNTAHNQAHKNINHPLVLKEIERQFKLRSRMTEDEMIARLEAMASADMGAFVSISDEGDLIFSRDALAEYGHLVEAIKQTQYGIAVTLHNPQKALELLGKTKALFVERHMVDLLDGLEIVEQDEAAESEAAD